MLQGEMSLLSISSYQGEIDDSSNMDVSTIEYKYPFSYPMPFNYTNVDVDLTDLDPR
jgi:hypothetical protein